MSHVFKAYPRTLSKNDAEVNLSFANAIFFSWNKFLL